MAWSPANKRYSIRVIVLSLIYAGALIAAVTLFRDHRLSGPLAYIVAALPAVPIIGVFVAMGRYLVEESDEYLRMLVIRQTLWASGITLSLATLWGFLESFGLAHHIAAYYVSVIWFAGLGLGGLINRLTLGDAGRC